jgi:hypothetical protein
VRFRFEQRFHGDVDAVARAYADPSLYDMLGELPKLGDPTVVDREADGDTVRLRVRFRFTGDLSAAARAVLDPAKLTWVEESTHDLAAHHVTFRLVPDHYGDRLRASGEYTFDDLGDRGTRRTSAGEVTVRTPFVGGVVERAIVSGLREHLEAEVAVVERFLAG